jgi:hypothetical protein
MLVALLRESYPHAGIFVEFGLDGHGAGEGGFGPEHAYFCSDINARFGDADLVLVQYHAYGYKNFAEGFLRQLLLLKAQPHVVFLQHAVLEDLAGYVSQTEWALLEAAAARRSVGEKTTLRNYRPAPESTAFFAKQREVERSGSVALSLCAAIHPLDTRFTQRFGATF